MKSPYILITILFAFIIADTSAFDIPPRPKQYYCYSTVDSMYIDGKLDERSWQLVSWSEKFTDIQGSDKDIPEFNTRFKMLHDKNGLYIAAYLEEPHINASITEDDKVIFRDNDFEFFLDPDGDNHNYYELEINANNAHWDLFMCRPYRDKCSANTSWDIKGLNTSVYYYGSLNDPSDVDSCWIIEIFLPWESLVNHLPKKAPPKSRDVWRANFSRVQWEYDTINGEYIKKKAKGSDFPQKEENWVWSPQWVVNMHNPETWGYIIFAGHPQSMEPILSDPDPDYELKMFLVKLYHKQHRFFLKNQFFAKSFRELTGKDDMKYPITIETTSKQYIIYCSNYKDKIWYIDQSRKLWPEAIVRKK